MQPVSLLLVMTLAASLAAQNRTDPGQGTPRPAPTPMLLPQHVVLPRGDREMTVDGSLNDWPELPALRLDDNRQLSGTAYNAWIGPRDLRGAVFLMWDQEALWVSCAVTDEWHRALDANTLLVTEIPAADSVVLTFDPNRDTRASGNDPGRSEDREFWLADDPGHQVVQWDRLRGQARVLDAKAGRMVVTHDKEHGITNYEARIPWSEILAPGQVANAGRVVDFQIVVNDFDESTDPMPQTRIGATFGCNTVVDPGLLGSLMLVADASALQGAVPMFPPKPSAPGKPTPTPEEAQAMIEGLLQYPPAIYTGQGAPAECGGVKRTAVLEQIDSHHARMPRVDFLEFLQRVHRRMNREVAGIQARGLPRFWRQRLESVSKQAEDPVPAGALRLFRLPTGGWLCRYATGAFMVDPAGADVHEMLLGGAGFCVLTQPLDMTRRSDQLLIRMYSAEPPRHVFTHIAFHLPVIPMDVMPLVEPGKSYGTPLGCNVHAMGSKRADGKVTYSCSYRIDVPGGPTLALVGPNLVPGDFESTAIDVAIVSPRNPELPAILQKLAPQLVVIDEVFTCQSHPTTVRVALKDVFAIQQALVTTPSLVLAPGESWTVTAKTPK
ncbi:MAG: hypothetical protein JNK15_16405 [Planctomycetes bacterium]|nr:hypothetical protein [Planctomycetota bacterium]